MKQHSLIITIAGKHDAQLLVDISRRTFYDSFAQFNTRENMDKFMNEQLTKERIIAEVNDPSYIFLIAWDEDEPLGYVCMRKSHTPPGLNYREATEISRIYVEQKAIGRGVGHALMQKTIDIATEKNNQVIWLGVWEHNQRAIDFYHKLGFKRFGQHIFMLGDDVQTDWLMSREL